MRTDDVESVGYEFRVEIRRFVDDQIAVRWFPCGGCIAGDDNTVNFRVVLVDFVQKLHAGKTRHVKIGDDDCRTGVAADRLEGFARVRVDSYVFKTGETQTFGNDVGDIGHIVDDDDTV